MSELEQLQAAVQDCRKQESDCIKRIIALGDELPPFGDPPDTYTEQVKALEEKRVAMVKRREKLQAGLAGLQGRLAAMKKAAAKQGNTVQAEIEAALAELETASETH